MPKVSYVTLSSDKRKIISIILCCLGFVGIAGIHRFYVGKIWTGLLWLFTAGLFGIGTIVDLVNIILGSFKDNVGVPLRK